MIYSCPYAQIAEKGAEVSEIPRHELWKEGHVNKEGQIDNEHVQQVWNKCVCNNFLNCKLLTLISFLVH